MNASRWVLIAANPKSGSGPSGELVQRLADQIEQRGFKVEVIRSLDQLKQTAEHLHSRRDLHCVVCAGGDGTVAVVANLLPHDISLFVFPLGTENLLAKHWGLSRDVAQACTAIVGGRTIQMDVGLANGKMFLVMLGCGFDAEVVRQMDLRRTGHITRFSYTMPILRALKGYRFPQLKWDAHCANQSGQAAWLFAFNVPRYGGNLSFFPDADPCDGRLDLCLFKRSGIWKGCNYLFQLWRQKHQQLEDFQHACFRKLSVEAPVDTKGQAIQVPYQLDGDPGGFLPLEVETLPARLKLIVPHTTPASDPIPVSPMPVPTT
ncbi:MAG: diacylglycerol kinase family protein [Pirellulales bacterium]